MEILAVIVSLLIGLAIGYFFSIKIDFIEKFKGFFYKNFYYLLALNKILSFCFFA